MTDSERLDRIEHITAGIAEERRKDREEYKTFWRDSQRQIEALNAAVLKTSADLDRFIVETRIKFEDTDDRIRQTNLDLDARIEKLVVAMGELVRGQKTA